MAHYARCHLSIQPPLFKTFVPTYNRGKKQIICEHFFLLNHFLFNVIYELYYCQHIFDININCIFGMLVEMEISY